MERRVGFAELSMDDYRAASPAFGEDVYAKLDVRRSLESRRGPGMPSPDNVAERLAHWRSVLQDDPS